MPNRECRMPECRQLNLYFLDKQMLSNTQLSMSTLVMVVLKQSNRFHPFWRAANPLSCRQGLRIGDSRLVWVTNITYEYAHVLESHAVLIQIQGHSQGCLISFVYLVQHLVTVCIYIHYMYTTKYSYACNHN